MKRSFLEGLGLEAEKIDKIMAEHGSTVQGLQNQVTTLTADLGAANNLVKDLQKTNTDNKELQTKVTDYETKITTLEKERAQERAEWQAKEALKDAKDIDYALFKLKQGGELVLDKDGKVKDLENRIKALREASPSVFNESDEDKEKDKPGYTVVTNPLKPQSQKQTFDLSKMTPEEINANWDAISSQEPGK